MFVFGVLLTIYSSFFFLLLEGSLLSSVEVDHFCPSEHRLAVLKQTIKVYQAHSMPEAVAASLPTASTVPHTDDDSSPGPI